jgi:hypothetical protein
MGGREPVCKRLWKQRTGGRGGRGQRSVATRAAPVLVRGFHQTRHLPYPMLALGGRGGREGA